MVETVGVTGDNTGCSGAFCDLFGAFSRLNTNIIEKRCFKVLFIFHSS